MYRYPRPRPRAIRAFTFLEMLVVIVLLGILVSYSVSGLYVIAHRYSFRSKVHSFQAYTYRARQQAHERFVNTYVLLKDSSIPDATAIAWINGDPSVPTGHVVGVSGNLELLIINQYPDGVTAIGERGTYPTLRILSNVRYLRFSPTGNGRSYSSALLPNSSEIWSFCDQVNCFSSPSRTEALMFSQRDQPFTIYIAPKDIGTAPTTQLPCPPDSRYGDDACYVAEQTSTNLRLCQGNIGDTTLNNVFAGPIKDGCS